MYIIEAGLSKIIVMIALIASAVLPVKATVTIASVSCSAEAKRLTIQFTSDGMPIDRFQRAEVVGDDIVVRFVGAALRADVALDACKDNGVAIRAENIREYLVFRIRASAYRGDISIRRSGPSQVVLTIDAPDEDDAPMRATPASSSATAAPTSSAKAKNWQLDVIVLDAGHGGKDYGAIGVNGVAEKTVTLAIAKRLRDLIRKEFPSTTVVMTRDDDTFVELHRRTQIANNVKGKLFISIHCNSMPKIPHPARGCETYILRPGRNEDAARVAATENSSIKLETSQDEYKGLTEEELILATMAQRSFVRYSEELASLVQKHTSQRTGLKSRGVNQAGFLVLVGASMPNILFETAFLSNPDDAQIICSEHGQASMAQGMFAAIKEYAAFYTATLEK